MSGNLSLVKPDQRQDTIRVQAKQRTRRRKVYMSHSARELYTTCGKKYRKQYLERITSDAESANLGFGKAVHRGCEVFLIKEATGRDAGDPIQEFDRVFNEFCNTQVVEFSSRWDRQKMVATGHRLIRLFMEDWKRQGLMVILDVYGEPVLERRLRIELEGDVVFTAIIDVMAMTPDGRVLVIDLKTPGQVGFDGFTELSDQLIGYQVVADAHAPVLGIHQVDGRAFYELLKMPVPALSSKAKGPRVLPFHPVGRANNEDIRDWMLETIAIANDIRKDRFPRRAGDAYNSPCKMCNLLKHCITGSMDGLRIKPKYDTVAYGQQQVGQPAVAQTGADPNGAPPF